jgi:predicted molibdopterin-dependent oxidoreductase YjgC
VVYTTFHHPATGTNVVTTDNSDWATNCPEYKVTAVDVCLVTNQSEWQERYRDFTDQQEALLKQREFHDRSQVVYKAALYTMTVLDPELTTDEAQESLEFLSRGRQ